MANVDDVDQALEFENEGGFLADDFDDDDLLAAAVRAEQERFGGGEISAAPCESLERFSDSRKW